MRRWRCFRTWRVSGSKTAVGYTSLSVELREREGSIGVELYRGDSVVALWTRCLVAASELRDQGSPADGEQWE